MDTYWAPDSYPRMWICLRGQINTRGKNLTLSLTFGPPDTSVFRGGDQAKRKGKISYHWIEFLACRGYVGGGCQKYVVTGKVLTTAFEVLEIAAH